MSANGYNLEIEEVEPSLFGITASAKVGIGQRALLVRTAAGNLLWDPTGFVDDAGAQRIRDLGGAVAIAARHPHMFGAQVAWSRALGGAAVLVAEADRSWIQRADPVIRLWTGDLEVLPGVTLRTVGGHFPGSAVAYWAAGAGGRGALLAGDTIFPGPNGRWVTFMRSFTETIPLSAAVVGGLSRRRLNDHSIACIAISAASSIRMPMLSCDVRPTDIWAGCAETLIT